MKEWFVPLLTHMQLLANHRTCSCCNLVFRRSQASLWDINGCPKEAPLPSCSVSAKKWLQSEFISSDSALKGSRDIWIAKRDDFDADEVTRQSWRPHFLLQMKFSTNVQYFLPEACYVFTKGQSISAASTTDQPHLEVGDSTTKFTSQLWLHLVILQLQTHLNGYKYRHKKFRVINCRWPPHHPLLNITGSHKP